LLEGDEKKIVKHETDCCWENCLQSAKHTVGTTY
jgi:hypothetical protein